MFLMVTPQWQEEVDVVVIGSGLAGLSAAIEASQTGASVIVFEKMNVTGGNSRIADGGLAAPNSFLQQQKGITDSPELFYRDMMNAGLFLNHPELVSVVSEKAEEAIEWTRTELGVQYLNRLDRSGGHSVARTLTTRSHSGSEIIKAMTKRLKDLNCSVRLNSLLTALITDKNNCVCGVSIRSAYKFPNEASGEAVHIRARRGVVLATGGFSGDVGFRELQNPMLDNSIGTTNHRGATGEGMRAALRINAAPVHLSWIQTGPWSCADEPGYGKGARFASYAAFPEGIVIDPTSGERILNEWGDRRERSEAIIKCGQPAIAIIDREGARLDAKSLNHCLKKGKIREFKSLSDLSKGHNIHLRQLQETISLYNSMVEKGVTDRFGKELGKARVLTGPIYYTIRLWPKVHHTPGGIAIDREARVLDLDGQQIKGLFAAGEVSGGVHGASRLGSCALPECMIFGRIAGRNAASST